jgi:hypothetical protein
MKSQRTFRLRNLCESFQKIWSTVLFYTRMLCSLLHGTFKLLKVLREQKVRVAEEAGMLDQGFGIIATVCTACFVCPFLIDSSRPTVCKSVQQDLRFLGRWRFSALYWILGGNKDRDVVRVALKLLV